jgi:transposase
MVHPADVQDRDGVEPLLRQARRLFPFIERAIGDAGYQGPTGSWRWRSCGAVIGTASSSCPKRWIIERTLDWISRNRRLARDFQRHCRIAAAFVRVAMIRIMLRQLAATTSA